MLSVTRLLNGSVEPADALRYGRSTGESPAHLLHFSEDKKPVVVWNVGRRCNLHCGHCYSDSFDKEYPDELTTAEGLTLLDDLASFGVPTVLFSGGEPLMRADIFELAAAAGERGMRTVLSTNGTLIDEPMAEAIKVAGFSYVGISLDGLRQAHDKIRGKKGSFDTAVTGIERCREIGIRTGIRLTVHGLNYRELDGIFDLAEKIAVERLCVYHLAYSGRGKKIQKHDLEPALTRRIVEQIFDRVSDFKARDIEMEVLTVDNPVDGVLLYKRTAEREPERAEDVMTMLKWNGGNQSGIAIACIDPQGNVHPDQFSWHQTAGNVRQTPFGEIWGDPDNPVLAPYRERPRRIEGRCAACHWRPICNGGLRVRAESATGSAEMPDPACYLSDEEVGGRL